MSAKKMTAEERKMSNAIMENLRKLMTERHIATQKEVYSNIPAFTQSQFSNVYNGENFPTMMQLIGLADYFHVSIDYLLDREISETKKEMNVVDVCSLMKNLLNPYKKNSFLNANIGPVDLGIDSYENPIIYTGIYFPEDKCALTADEQLQDANSKIINRFIERIMQLNVMCSKGDLIEDMYNRLAESYLNDVRQESGKTSEDFELPFN